MIRDMLFPFGDPYKGFLPSPSRIHGWGSDDPNFSAVIDRTSPGLVIEVGSWLGASAMHMSSILVSYTKRFEIVCVDTWLGSTEMWTDTKDTTRYGLLDLNHGYPELYYQFLSNVVNEGWSKHITPFPQTSANAARWFKKNNIQADLIYLDASHEYDDVLMDLRMYYPLVRMGGILFGDDWQTFHDVTRALNDFGLPYDKVGRQWVIRKAKND